MITIGSNYTPQTSYTGFRITLPVRWDEPHNTGPGGHSARRLIMGQAYIRDSESAQNTQNFLITGATTGQREGKDTFLIAGERSSMLVWGSTVPFTLKHNDAITGEFYYRVRMD